jgi:phosphonate transport system substrate-binding protein
MVMPRETLGLYEELLRYMGDKLEKRVELVQRRTYHEINELMEGRLVDVAFVCSLPYVLGHDRFGMELLVAPEVNGKPVYYSYIITRADSGIYSLGGLRGKTFAFMDPESNTGTLYPTYKLALMGESPTSFFYNYVYTYSHDNSVRAVLSRAVDGAAVDSLVLDYMAAGDPTIASQIRVIEKSPPFGIPPVVVHPALDPFLKEQLRGILLNLDGDARGREILRRMNIDRFVPQSDSAYDSIREMYSMVQGITLESRNSR